jgi:hypothetical protein
MIFFLGLVQSLTKVKTSNNVVKLAIKHGILTVVVSLDVRAFCQ